MLPSESLRQKKYGENPNPNAKVGFVICYPFQYYVQKNIYKHLRDEAEFIIDAGVYFPNTQPRALIDDIVALLRKENVYYRVLYYDDYFYNPILERFFLKYRVLVSLWEWGCMKFRCNDNKKRIRLAYGAGKELTLVRPTGAKFDVSLAYGKHDARLLSLFSHCEIIGNPKFDDWFNDKCEILPDIQKRVDPKKKTVLYLPTHGDLCSIDELHPELKKIAGTYNLIVKFHYHTIRDEPERIKKMESGSIILLKDDVDLLPLLKLSDAVISDNSSAIFDAILADKPIVVTDFLEDKFFTAEHQKLRLTRRGITAPLTFPGSIEQVIKRKKLIPTIQSPGELKGVMLNALQDKDFFKNARKKIREHLFAYRDGQCGRRGAEVIQKIMDGKLCLPKKIFYYMLPPPTQLVENFYNESKKTRVQNHIKIHFQSKEEEKRNLLQSNVKIIDGIIFSIILPLYGTANLIQASIRSLLALRFPAHKFEIILINCGAGNISLPENHAGIKVIFSKDTADTISQAIKIGLSYATGIYICLGQPHYFYHSDWLRHLFRAYQENFSVAGVGGYEAASKELKNSFSAYYEMELKRKMNLQRDPVDFPTRFYHVKNKLFYQNPAGVLSNISYRRDIMCQFDFLAFSATPEVMEFELKQAVLMTGRHLYFNAFPCFSLERIGIKKFLHKNFCEGIAFYTIFSRDPFLKPHYKYTPFTLFRISLNNFFDRPLEVKLLATTILGTFVRIFGTCYAAIFSFSVFILKLRRVS